jgi:uncharacterized protein involved in type VI secretion and phage assembly
MTLLVDHRPTIEEWGLYLGLYPATVTRLAGDPQQQQRIEVALDWLAATDGDDPPTAWAVVVSPYADADQGIQMLPEVGSTVVVGFLAGHPDHPYVLGATWNGNAEAPDTFDDANNTRVIQTRSGTRLEFDDTEGAAAVRLSVAGTTGKHSLVFDDAARTITLTSASGATITMTASGGVNIDAAATVDITAAMVTVNAAMSDFKGVVKCETLIASSGGVISPSYTPGAGNVW